jgi:repressor LexA
MRFGDLLKVLREKNDFTREGLGRRAGVSGPYISQLETHDRKPPPPETLQKVIEALALSTKDAADLKTLAIIGRSGPEHMGIVKKALSKESQYLAMPKYEEDYAKIPLLGRCPASSKVWVADEVDGWYYFPKAVIKERRVYLLRVNGDSMNRVVNDGDIVMVEADALPKQGEIVVMCIDDEYTMKRYTQAGDKIVLNPDSTNPIHQPTILDIRFETRFRGVVRSIVMKDIK